MNRSSNAMPSRKYVDCNEITDLIRGETNNNVLRAACASVCHFFSFTHYSFAWKCASLVCNRNITIRSFFFVSCFWWLWNMLCGKLQQKPAPTWIPLNRSEKQKQANDSIIQTVRLMKTMHFFGSSFSLFCVSDSSICRCRRKWCASLFIGMNRQ